MSQLGMSINVSAALFSETTKPDFFWRNNNKTSTCFQNYPYTYNVEILNSFNPELQLKNTEFTIKNKLKNLLNELRGFKFVKILVLQKQKTKKKSVVRLWQRYKNTIQKA